MSAKEKQVVEIQGKLEDITECPICTETYKEPKILPCIHTFCMKCLQETGLKINKSPGDKMPCPVCRTEFTVPEKGFVGLQRNFFMERLIEMKDILNPSSESVLCDACQEDSDLGAEVEIPSAAMYCADCNQRLCGECCKNHKKCKATKNHRMLHLDGAQINIPSIIVKPYVCDKHENKLLEIYCSSCQEVVCALCFYKSHKTHETSPVIEVITDFRKIVQENADTMMIFSRHLKEKTTRKNSDKEMFVEKMAAVESEIKRVRQNLQECTETDCDSLLQQLCLIKQERIKDNEGQLCDIEIVLASLVSYQAYCSKITEIGSDIDICRAVHNLKIRAAELKQLYESVSLESFPNIWLKKAEFYDAFFRIGNNIIGKIQENGDNKASEVEDFTNKISSDELDKLKKELNLQQERISRQDEVILLMNHEADEMKLTGLQSDEKIIDLKQQVALLSSIAYNGDKTKEVKKTSHLSKGLTFLQTISTLDVPDEKEYRVTGLAIIDNELFITSASNVVEVNDRRTLKFKRRWRVEEMNTVLDMTANGHNKCLYLLCGLGPVDRLSNPEARLLRCNVKGTVVRQWKPDVVVLTPGFAQISVTDKANVLVTNGSASKFTEYSPDGVIIRVVSLKWETGIQNLMHAMKLTSDHFLICHGNYQDSLHRVCIIDMDGNVLKYYGYIRQTDKLKNPTYLEMAEDGEILVADHLNKRLLLFNSSLELINQLNLPNPFDPYCVIDRKPRKMLLDEANGRIFVTENIWQEPEKGHGKTQYGDRLSVFTFPTQ